MPTRTHLPIAPGSPGHEALIALNEARQAKLFSRRSWLPNLSSGVVVGVVALPLAMAFAIASGVKPEQGLYTAIIAGILVSLFGGSRVQIAGPTGAFIVILSGITAEHGVDGLIISTMMAGVILMVMGFAKLGGLIKYIPAPVILGFTAGIGVVIWVGQWEEFFGLPKATGRHLHETLPQLLSSLARPHPTTTAIAVGALVVVLFLSRIPYLKRVPGPLAALVLATSVQTVFDFPGVDTIGSVFGGIPQGLPELSFPHCTIAKVVDLIGPAFAIALLGAIESLLSAVVADGMTGTRHDPNQELIGQGLANVVAPLFGGFAATGAIARTATNVRNGGNSPLSGIFHSLTLVAVILFLAPLAADVPLAALAAILFVVAWNMSDVPHVLRMLRTAPKGDVAILLVTFSLTVVADLLVAVQIGVLLATLDFLRRMSSSVEVAELAADDLDKELRTLGLPALPSNILVYAIQGPFFFAAVEHFEHALAHSHTDPSVVIIRLKWVPFIDITGIHTLEHVVVDLRKRGVRVMLSGANEQVRLKLAKAGLLDLVGYDNVFDKFTQAVLACQQNPGDRAATR